jgi:signal transduction histidine kinase
MGTKDSNHGKGRADSAPMRLENGFTGDRFVPRPEQRKPREYFKTHFPVSPNEREQSIGWPKPSRSSSSVAMKHKKDLDRQPEDPVKTNHQPQKTVVGHKSVADASANNRPPPGKSLSDSLQLQQRLRQLTHHLLAAQEDEREKLSHELRDEIAQTLLGINVRLLLLKQAARSKANGLKSEIVCTQRLVGRSAMLVRRLARELENHRRTPSEQTVTAIRKRICRRLSVPD